NRENLAMTEGEPAVATDGASAAPPRREVLSWWDGARRSTAVTTFARHALYFGVPLGVLTAGAYLVWRDPMAHEPALLQARAREEFGAGHDSESLALARRALAAYERQLALEEAMIAVRPSAVHYAQMAQLI